MATALQTRDQAIADLTTKLAARSGPVYTLALRSPFAPFGSGRPPLLAWREGRTAHLQGFLVTSVQADAGDRLVTQVGLPPELVPTVFHPSPAGATATAYAYPLIANGNSVGRLDVSASGAIVASLTATLPAGVWIIVAGSYPLD